MSADQPLVSVVLAVQNGERYLAQAIESVLAQSYLTFEIILIDDGSNDDTEKIARSYTEVRYFRQANQGLAIARNIGIEYARGQLIAFLSHDDLWLPNKLRSQADYFARAPETQYTVTWFKYFLEPGFGLPPGFKPELLGKSLIGRIPETVVARRQLFDQIGKFNPDFNFADDVDWFARAKDHGAPMAVIPEVLLLKRLHDSNMTYNSIQNGELLGLLKQSIQRQRQQQPARIDERKGI
jgi:glycosyltransferase involved in cell wall biosynthesis